MLIQADLAQGIPLANNLVHCVVTSIPYFGLRSYDVPPQVWGGDPLHEHNWKSFTRKGISGGKNSALQAGKGQVNFQEVPATENAICECGAWYGFLGLEPTFEMFLEHNVLLFREVRRVMRDDAVLFLNVGDSFAGSGGPGSQYDAIATNGYKEGFEKFDNPNRKVEGMPDKNKMGIPFRLLFAMVDDGWIWRQDIIWAKGVSFNKGEQFDQDYAGSVMPESVNGWRWERHKIKVKSGAQGGRQQLKPEPYTKETHPSTKERPTYIECPGCDKCNPYGGFVLRKGSWRPTTSHEFVFMLTKTDEYYCDRDAVSEVLKESSIGGAFGGKKRAGGNNNRYSGKAYNPDHLSGRNVRSVWTISPQGYSGKHFASFGPALIEPMIKVATPEKVCGECGAPWARVVDRKSVERYELDPSDPNYRPTRYKTKYDDLKNDGTGMRFASSSTLDWWPTCDHESESIPGLVYDPFMGSGTVGMVAANLGRRWVGTDLGWDYLLQAKERTGINALADFWQEYQEWQEGVKDNSKLDDLPMFAGLK